MSKMLHFCKNRDECEICKRKKFILKVAQNGGEYHGYTTIKGRNIVKLDDNTVIVDGVEIYFDEYIADIKVKNE